MTYTKAWMNWKTLSEKTWYKSSYLHESLEKTMPIRWWKANQWLTGKEKKGKEKSWLGWGRREILRVMKMFYNTIVEVVTQVYKFVKIHQNGSDIKYLPTVWETWVQSLGWEDLLEREMATHSSILAWKTPWTEEPGRLPSMGSQRVGHDWVTSLSLSLCKLYLSNICWKVLCECIACMEI